MNTAAWICALIAAFFLGWLWHPSPEQPSPPQKPNELETLARLTGNHYPFAEVIEGTCACKIISFDSLKAPHVTIRNAILEAAEETRLTLSQEGSPIRTQRRINEASRFFENALRERLDAHPELSCIIPKNTAGKEQRSGYPDLRIEHVASQTVAYLDPKLFEEKSRTSSLRTFYYEPSDTHKVTEDAIHFLVGFPHDGKTREWTFSSPELVDLSTLQVSLKAEFSASNRDLY